MKRARFASNAFLPAGVSETRTTRRSVGVALARDEPGADERVDHLGRRRRREVGGGGEVDAVRLPSRRSAPRRRKWANPIAPAMPAVAAAEPAVGGEHLLQREAELLERGLAATRPGRPRSCRLERRLGGGPVALGRVGVAGAALRRGGG